MMGSRTWWKHSCYATNTRQTIVWNRSFIPVSGRSMTLREGGFNSSVEGISIFATGSLLKMIPELRAKRTVSSSFRSEKKNCHVLSILFSIVNYLKWLKYECWLSEVQKRHRKFPLIFCTRLKQHLKAETCAIEDLNPDRELTISLIPLVIVQQKLPFPLDDLYDLIMTNYKVTNHSTLLGVFIYQNTLQRMEPHLNKNLVESTTNQH